MTKSHPTKVIKLGATHVGTKVTHHSQKGFILLSSQVYFPDLYLYCFNSWRPSEVTKPLGKCSSYMEFLINFIKFLNIDLVKLIFIKENNLVANSMLDIQKIKFICPKSLLLL